MKKIIIFGLFLLILEAKNYIPNSSQINNPLYQKECASCHFGYQGWLMPSSSWEYIMENLDNHYGVDASLDEEDLKQIKEYLIQNSSQNSWSKRSRKINASLKPNTIYTSITQIPYFQKKHRKIPQNLIKQNEVKSLARCNACHQNAGDGIYDDKTIRIPNYGAWRD